MSDPTDPLSWAAYAEEDWELAKSVLRRKRPLTNAACFHAQQAAEKYLKALLVSKKVAFPKTHDLVTLNDLCSGAGIFLGMRREQLDTLSGHAIATRYPGDAPTLEEAREALAIAKAVRKFARQYLGVKK